MIPNIYRLLFLFDFERRFNEPTSPLPESGSSRASFSSQRSVKSQELKETLQALSTASIELENAQKQVNELKKNMEEKDSYLKKAQDERDSAEKAKILFDTEIKVRLFCCGILSRKHFMKNEIDPPYF